MKNRILFYFLNVLGSKNENFECSTFKILMSSYKQYPTLEVMKIFRTIIRNSKSVFESLTLESKILVNQKVLRNLMKNFTKNSIIN